MAARLSVELSEVVAAFASDELRMDLGFAAKDAAIRLAERDAGPERSLSGIPRKHKLDAGFDVTPTGVQLNLRPPGLWILLDAGRRAKPYSQIPKLARRRRRRPRRPALSTPQGYRYRTAIGSSRGKGTLTDLQAELDRVIPETIDNMIASRR